MVMKKPDGTVRGINKVWALMLAEHLGIQNPMQWLKEGSRRFEENLRSMLDDPANKDANGKFSIQLAKQNIFVNSGEQELDFMIRSVDSVSRQAIFSRPKGAQAVVTSSRKPDATVRGLNKIWAIILAEHLGIAGDPNSWLREGKRRFQENLKALIHDPENLDEKGNFSIKKAKENVFVHCTEQERTALVETADGITKQARYRQHQLAKHKSLRVGDATITK